MDISAKKENGAVFTPQWVADFMAGEIFKNQKIIGNEKILDAGCGEGVFSVAAVRKFSELSGKPVERVIEENIYFIDISPDYIRPTAQKFTPRNFQISREPNEE